MLEVFLAVERSCPGNPSSAHAAGRRARLVLEEARAEAAAALGVASDAIVFLSGGTEANHLAIRGLGDPALPVLCSDVEHKSALAAAATRGTVRWRVDRDGRAEVVAPTQPVGLIVLAHAQGEVGSLQPVAVAGALARQLGVPLHVDAAQTLGRVSLAAALGVADTLALSVHKAGGLRGASVLVVSGRRPRALLSGGGQELGLRSGTVSPSLAAATARAIALAVTETEARAARMQAARDALAAALTDKVALDRITPDEHTLPNTLLVHIAGVDGRALLPALDLAGVLASQGSACTSGAPEPPAILIAMGHDEPFARRCVRFSTSAHTSIADAIDAAQRIAEIVTHLRARRASS